MMARQNAASTLPTMTPMGRSFEACTEEYRRLVTTTELDDAFRSEVTLRAAAALCIESVNTPLVTLVWCGAGIGIGIGIRKRKRNRNRKRKRNRKMKRKRKRKIFRERKAKGNERNRRTKMGRTRGRTRQKKEEEK